MYTDCRCRDESNVGIWNKTRSNKDVSDSKGNGEVL